MKTIKYLLIIQLSVFTISVYAQNQIRVINGDLQIPDDKNLSFGPGDRGEWAIEYWEDGLNIFKPCPSSYCANYKMFIQNSTGRVGIGAKPLYGKLDIRAEGMNDGISLYNNTGKTFQIFRIGDVAYITRDNSQSKGITITSNGNIGINRIPSYWLDVYGTARVTGLINTSDIRLKKNVLEFSGTTEKLKMLKGVTYNITAQVAKENIESNNNVEETVDERIHYGFVAQDFKNVFPELVYEDNQGILGIDYISLIPILVKAINEINNESEKKDKKIIELENKINNLEELYYSTSSSAETNFELYNKKNDVNESAKLFQNNPNPFNSNTTINYFLPYASNNSFIFIYDLQGIQKKKIKIEQKGNGSVTLIGSEFNPGMFIYSLVVDGKEVDTKRMILTD